MLKVECYMSLVKFLYRNLSQANLVRGDSLFNFYIPPTSVPFTSFSFYPTISSCVLPLNVP
jgi:hypothetical protein